MLCGRRKSISLSRDLRGGQCSITHDYRTQSAKQGCARELVGPACPLTLISAPGHMRLLWVLSVTRGTGPGWGGCDDPSGARVAQGGSAQAGADDALTEAGRGAGSPGADHPARG